MGKIKDLTGQKFGRLLVIRLNHVNKKAYWYNYQKGGIYEFRCIYKL